MDIDQFIASFIQKINRVFLLKKFMIIWLVLAALHLNFSFSLIKHTVGKESKNANKSKKTDFYKIFDLQMSKKKMAIKLFEVSFMQFAFLFSQLF